MPLSMVTSTVFSEVIWQRVWASETRGSLLFGSHLLLLLRDPLFIAYFLGAAAAALLVAFVVLVSGVFGILVLVARRTCTAFFLTPCFLFDYYKALGKNNDNILIFSAVNSVTFIVYAVFPTRFLLFI
jgi:hypothetical protein